MPKHNILADAVRTSLLCGATLSAFSFPVLAAEEGEGADIERLEVTGSRLRGTDLQGFTPIQTIGAEEIDSSAVVNLQDLLVKNPAFGSPAISRTNSNFSTASAGTATVDLRNLGTDRTLVLVNGRRHVAGIPGSSAVDLNTIPTQFIKRVEIMTGGASAAYGSDAMAGVVNIILKDDFEGLEFDYQYGESQESDNEEHQVQFTIGTTSADGKGNMMIHAGYTSQGAVYSRDRERSAVDQISSIYFTGEGADAFTPTRPFFSSYTPQGRFFTSGGQFTFDKSNNLLEGFVTNGNDERAPDGFNRSAFRTIAIPTERYLFSANGNYEFADGWSAFIEGTYAGSQTQTELEPFPLASSDIFGSGGMPLEYMVDGAMVRNPFAPDAIYNAATDTDGDGLRDIAFTKRLIGVANRGNVADRDTYRLLTGIEGELSDSWTMELYYGYGQTNESQVSSGQVNVLNFKSALEVVDDGNGGLMCLDPLAREQGCVPLNIFGFGSISPEAAAYVSAPGLYASFITQEYAGLDVTGELFELPAGMVSLAAGYEWREETSRSEFDALQQAGLNAGNKIPREEGSFNVSDVYAEVVVPLLSDMPMVDQMNLRGAIRFSDYSTVGNTTSWNVALDWAPMEEIKLRAIRAQSVRAPNISELFSPPSQTFPTGLADPCEGVTLTSSEPQAAACRADAGVLANIQQNGAFTLTQGDLQGISGFNRGNPDLSEEKGTSWIFGATISPENIAVIEDFDFQIDYYDIEIEDAIVSTPRQFILDQCYTGDASLCQFVTRRPTAQAGNSAGSIEFIDSAVTNNGGFTAKGIDFVVAYNKELEDYGLVGDVSANLAYNHVLDLFTIPLPGADVEDDNGEIDSPTDKFNLTLGYALDDLRVTWNVQYIGKSYLDDGFLASFGLEPESVGVGSVTYHDVNVSYTPFENAELYVGVNNLFDKEPPAIITGLPGNNTGTETAASTYDPIGRDYYAGFRLKF